MKKSLFAAAAAIGLMATPALAGDPTGLWATEKNDEGAYLTVDVKPCGDKMCGYIASAVGGNGEADPNYEHLGKPMVYDMVADGENKWDDGEIWDPSEDKRYSSNMELKGDLLVVEGCILFLCRGQDWTRAN